MQIYSHIQVLLINHFIFGFQLRVFTYDSLNLTFRLQCKILHRSCKIFFRSISAIWREETIQIGLCSTAASVGEAIVFTLRDTIIDVTAAYFVIDLMCMFVK